MYIKVCNICREPIDGVNYYRLDSNDNVHLHFSCARGIPFDELAERVGLYLASEIPVIKRDRVKDDFATQVDETDVYGNG